MQLDINDKKRLLLPVLSLWVKLSTAVGSFRPRDLGNWPVEVLQGTLPPGCCEGNALST